MFIVIDYSILLLIWIWFIVKFSFFVITLINRPYQLSFGVDWVIWQMLFRLLGLREDFYW